MSGTSSLRSTTARGAVGLPEPGAPSPSKPAAHGRSPVIRRRSGATGRGRRELVSLAHLRTRRCGRAGVSLQRLGREPAVRPPAAGVDRGRAWDGALGLWFDRVYERRWPPGIRALLLSTPSSARSSRYSRNVRTNRWVFGHGGRHFLLRETFIFANSGHARMGRRLCPPFRGWVRCFATHRTVPPLRHQLADSGYAGCVSTGTTAPATAPGTLDDANR